MQIAYQQNLFNQLEALVAEGETFYRQEFELDGLTYWIYNYRLASYTEFLKPGAMECRGIMFQVSKDGYPLNLAAHPMPKFFNLNENPFTMNLDLSKIKEVHVKADGSLMSTYLHNATLRLKSKGSLFSEQAIHAMEFLGRPENQTLSDELAHATRCGFTVNLEWCAPQHRIVIGYLEPRLTVLNVRNMNDGTFVDPWQVEWMHEIRNLHVDKVPFDDLFIARVPNMEGIEGFVVELESGLHFKIKTIWYLALHKTKDSVNSDRRLYEAVLAEASDDLRALFHDDVLVIRRIAAMETFVQEKYNKLVAGVEKYVAANKTMVRKDFAILGQKVLDKHEFRLAMALYTGQTVNFKQYMIDHWKEFGVKDEPLKIVELAA